MAALTVSLWAPILAQAARPMQPLHFLIGNWTCSLTMNGKKSSYRATFAPAIGMSAIRQNDVWSQGGSDEGLYTHPAGKHVWLMTIFEEDGNVTMFQGSDASAKHVIFHEIYPSRDAQESFDVRSPTEYHVAFDGIYAGARLKSNDVCIRDR